MTSVVCEKGPVVSLGSDGGSVTIQRVSCDRWDCEVCGTRKAKRYYGIACKGLGVTPENRAGTQPCQLLTLTFDTRERFGEENKVSRIEAWEVFYICQKLFFKRLSYHYGRIPRFSVIESTSRGYPHLHSILKTELVIPQGWRPETEDGRGYIREEEIKGRPSLARMAEESGLGKVVHIVKVNHDNALGAVNYVLKYVFKALKETGLPPNVRRVRYTNDWSDKAGTEETASEWEYAAFWRERDAVSAAMEVEHDIWSGMDGRTTIKLLKRSQEELLRLALDAFAES